MRVALSAALWLWLGGMAEACIVTQDLGRRAMAANAGLLPEVHATEMVGSSGTPRVTLAPQAGCAPFDLAALALGGALARGDHLVLGEVHDNPAHHALRAMLIDFLATHPGVTQRPTIVMEHLGPEQAERIARYNANLAAGDDRALDRFLDGGWWDQSGWPAQTMFQPIFDVVRKHRLPLAAGNVARDRIRAIARGGLDAATAEERSALGLEHRAWDASREASLLTELEASHCGLMPSAAFKGLAVAQRARDGAMARAMIEAGKRGPVILLTGNGHARADRGVPFVLSVLDPRRAVVSVGFVERQPQPPADNQGRYDLVVTTVDVTRPDPCVEMRKAFEGRKKQ
jgi:uncharacterized iron-regulated protein